MAKNTTDSAPMTVEQVQELMARIAREQAATIQHPHTTWYLCVLLTPIGGAQVNSCGLFRHSATRTLDGVTTKFYEFWSYGGSTNAANRGTDWSVRATFPENEGREYIRAMRSEVSKKLIPESDQERAWEAYNFHFAK